MKRSKPPVKYQGFALEIPLIEEIKEYIKKDDRYRSVTDFVRQVIRDKMNEPRVVKTDDLKIMDGKIDFISGELQKLTAQVDVNKKKR